MTTKSFDCPNCGAPLDYEEGGAVTIRCAFCNSSVIVPEELRKPAQTQQQQQQPIFNQTPVVFTTVTSSAPPINVRRSGGGWGCFITVIVLIIVGSVVVPIVATGAGLWAAFSAVATVEPIAFPDMSEIAIPTFPAEINELLGTPAAPAFAEQTLAFGAEGTGPGMLDDSRVVSLDGDGNVYTGDYIGGRIQVFGKDGTFQTLWNIDPEIYLGGLAANRDGTVYIAQNGDIFRYDGQTGEQLGRVQYKGEGFVYFGDLAVTADGGLVALGDDLLVIFDSNGKALQAISIEDVPDANDFEEVAVDGTGAIYVLGQTLARGDFDYKVFQFTAEGQYLSQFGGRGDEAGQFSAPNEIAVDGQGRIYVSDGLDILVYDSNGRFITQFKTEGVVFGMTFNSPNELWAVSNANKIFQFTLPNS